MIGHLVMGLLGVVILIGVAIFTFKAFKDNKSKARKLGLCGLTIIAVASSAQDLAAIIMIRQAEQRIKTVSNITVALVDPVTQRIFVQQGDCGAIYHYDANRSWPIVPGALGTHGCNRAQADAIFIR